MAIMGPSGSGKSTLLHILGLLDSQSSGEYYFLGQPIAEITEEEQAILRNQKIGFVFQAFNLLPRRSVFDNVKLPLLYSAAPQKQWPERTAQAIEAVGLGHRTKHEPSQLSGGEKQRAAIARALVNSREVIFADEPTGNLDSKSGRVIMEIFENLNQKFGHTIILIAHETETAEHARRIIRLRDGRVESDELVREQKKAGEFYK